MKGISLKEVNEAHNIYLIRATDGLNTLVKLGYSNSIKKRITTYLQCNPFTEIVGTWKIDNAKEFEYMVHKNLESVAFNEWYGEDAIPTLLEWVSNGIPKTITDKIVASSLKNLPEIPEYLFDFPPKLWKKAFRGTGSFADLARLYYQYVVDGRDEAAKYVANLEPLILEAHKVIGVQKIRSLTYNKTKIRQALISSNNNRSSAWKVAKYLNLQEGLWYSTDELLKKMEIACEANGCSIPKSASKISDYYLVGSKRKRHNGKLLSGFIIVGSKFK